ncbi:neurofilament heavy polypeptide-like [Harmonia axyridis]|uniref:neurofilament heavy polypeptide-like n=1 Tax=Harmonia axyridis TaxID=115357 RepID=UPI001E277211|nr:neurofilament heavy polypeptide-like [Harmonia axyridis]
MQRNIVTRNSFSKRITSATENSRSNEPKKVVLPVKGTPKTITLAKTSKDQQTGNMSQNMKQKIQPTKEVQHTSTEKKSKKPFESLMKRLEQAEEIFKKYSPLQHVVKKEKNQLKESKLVKQPTSEKIIRNISKSEPPKKQTNQLAKKNQPIKQEVKTREPAIEKPNQKEMLAVKRSSSFKQQNTYLQRKDNQKELLTAKKQRSSSFRQPNTSYLPRKAVISQQGLKTDVKPVKELRNENISNSNTSQKKYQLLDEIFEKYKSIRQDTKSVQYPGCEKNSKTQIVANNGNCEEDSKKDNRNKENESGPMQTRLDDQEQKLLKMSNKETDFGKKMEILQKISDYQKKENERTVTNLSNIIEEGNMIFNRTP